MLGETPLHMVAPSILPPTTIVPCMVLLVYTPIVHRCVVQPLTPSNSHDCGLIIMTHYINIISLRDKSHVASVPLGILHQDALTSFQEHRNLGTHHSLASIGELLQGIFFLGKFSPKVLYFCRGHPSLLVLPPPHD